MGGEGHGDKEDSLPRGGGTCATGLVPCSGAAWRFDCPFFYSSAHVNASCLVCASTVGSLLFNGCRGRGVGGWNHHFWIKLSICPSIFAAFLKKQHDSPSSIQPSQSPPRVWMKFFFSIVLHCISYSVIFPDDCSPLNALQEWLWESRLIYHLFNDSQSFSALAGHFWLTSERRRLE